MHFYIETIFGFQHENYQMDVFRFFHDKMINWTAKNKELEEIIEEQHWKSQTNKIV